MEGDAQKRLHSLAYGVITRTYWWCILAFTLFALDGAVTAMLTENIENTEALRFTRDAKARLLICLLYTSPSPRD